MPAIEVLIKPGSTVYGVRPNRSLHKVREYRVQSIEIGEHDQVYHCLETGEPSPALDLYELFFSEFQQVMHH